MSAPQPDNAKQICENTLTEGKRYNIEHSILPSENAVADRLLARGIELSEAYDELHGKLHEHPHALQIFLGLVLSTAAFWNPEKTSTSRLRGRRQNWPVCCSSGPICTTPPASAPTPTTMCAM